MSPRIRFLGVASAIVASISVCAGFGLKGLMQSLEFSDDVTGTAGSAAGSPPQRVAKRSLQERSAKNTQNSLQLPTASQSQAPNKSQSNKPQSNKPQSNKPQTDRPPQAAKERSEPLKSLKSKAALKKALKNNQAPSSKPSALSTVPTKIPTNAATYLGHWRYPEAEKSRLINVGRFPRATSIRMEQLDPEAAKAFQTLVNAAQLDGIVLLPISGFRSIAEQKPLFERQQQRQGSPTAAARLSAPPGYSEHHTGYAIDIADAERPDSDLKTSFQNTNAYRWLKRHAQKYGFEPSFPLNNRQKVAFEPWHWRYVGSPRARQIFAKARPSQVLAKAKRP